MAFSGDRMPQCTCTPKIWSWRAIHWLRSRRAAYRGLSVIFWVTQSVIGCVPEQSTPMLRLSAAAATSATVPAKVGARLPDGLANAGDDLHARLEQLVFGLGMLTVAVFGDVGQDLVRGADQLAGLQIHQLELPLDTQAGPL
jgi:hypothetical protein